MTDKQMHSKNLSVELDKSRSTATSLIIDGVDVSGCRYLFDDTSYKRSKTTCSITLKDCKYLGNNCYYKQLKRKEQECEQQKAELELFKTSNQTTIDQLKAEIINKNEKIKELRFSVSDLTNRLCDLNAEKSFKIVDLEQTLAEIKEMCNSVENIENVKSLYDAALSGMYLQAKQILQKINEVENVNNNR